MKSKYAQKVNSTERTAIIYMRKYKDFVPQLEPYSAKGNLLKGAEKQKKE
jgi:hypothetical protein